MAINYEQVGWDTSKYVNPTRMNHMDDGIKAACDKVDAHDQQIETINSNLDGKLNKSSINVLNNSYLGYTANPLNFELDGDSIHSMYLVCLTNSDSNAYPTDKLWHLSFVYNNKVNALIDNGYCVVMKNGNILTISQGSTIAYVYAFIIKLA